MEDVSCKRGKEHRDAMDTIRIVTRNIDGAVVEREFETAEEILKNWWDEDSMELPAGDDEVLELVIYGKSVVLPKSFDNLICEFEREYWSRKELNVFG